MSRGPFGVRHDAFPEKVDRLYGLIEDIEVAIVTTRRRDGSLVSRPMAVQHRADGAHFWFVAEEGSPRLAEIARDPNVNLSFSKDRTREWVSVAGVARVSRDRAKIRELYDPSWKVWFPNHGAGRDGGPEDPRIALIAIEARSAHSMRVDKSAPAVLFQYAKGMVRGEKPDVREVEALSGDTLSN